MTQRPKRRSRLLTIGVGIIGACIVLVFVRAAVINVGQRIGVVPTWTPRPAATETLTPGPTDTPEPTNTQRPTRTIEPTNTRVPTRTAKPTSTPGATIVAIQTARATGDETVGNRGGTNDTPVFFGEGQDETVDPPWYPCLKGQIKGNQNSGIYHTSRGSFYAKTFDNVACFESTADAEAAGYRASER